jgi:hypothetical protein
MRCSHKVNAEVVREALVLRLAHDEQRAATAKGAPALLVVRSVLTVAGELLPRDLRGLRTCTGCCRRPQIARSNRLCLYKAMV